MVSDVETTGTQPSPFGRLAFRVSNHPWRTTHYWSKLLSAILMTALAGLGSYTATYRVLVLVFEPAVTTWHIPATWHLVAHLV